MWKQNISQCTERTQTLHMGDKRQSLGRGGEKLSTIIIAGTQYVIMINSWYIFIKTCIKNTQHNIFHPSSIRFTSDLVSFQIWDGKNVKEQIPKSDRVAKIESNLLAVAKGLCRTEDKSSQWISIIPNTWGLLRGLCLLSYSHFIMTLP